MFGLLFNSRSKGNGTGSGQSLVTTYTANHTVLLSQMGQTLVMNNTTNHVFTFPSVTTGDIGVWFIFVNINTGKLTIAAADSDIIADSAAGGTIYSDDDNIATITTELVSATQWLITGAHGTWVTT